MGLEASTLALLAQTAQGTAALGSSVAQAGAIRAQGGYERSIQEENARLAEMQAQDAIRRGEEAAGARRREGRQLVGRQRAAAAGQGVAVNQGTAYDIQLATEAAAARDAETIRMNSFREAWASRVEAADRRAAGRNAESGARFASRMTAATGGMQFGRDLLSGAYLANQMRTPANDDLGFGDPRVDGRLPASRYRAASIPRRTR